MIQPLKVTFVSFVLLGSCLAHIVPSKGDGDLLTQQVNELEETLAVNQLAILQVLNGKVPANNLVQLLSHHTRCSFHLSRKANYNQTNPQAK